MEEQNKEERNYLDRAVMHVIELITEAVSLLPKSSINHYHINVSSNIIEEIKWNIAVWNNGSPNVVIKRLGVKRPAGIDGWDNSVKLEFLSISKHILDELELGIRGFNDIADRLDEFLELR